MAAQHNVTTQGLAYSPSTLSANVGDTVTFTANFSFHPTVEVDQATWNSNGATRLLGGFGATSGNSFSVVLTAAGDRYYVCQNHVSSSNMKGMISVSAATGVKAPALTLSLYPNPAGNEIILPALPAGSVSVVTVAGQVAQTFTLTAGQQRLSVADLPPGAYMLRASGRSYRFVKE